MAVKSVHLLEVVLVMLLLIYQDVAYGRDLNQANGGAGLLNGGEYINPGGPLEGYGQPLYVIIYGDGFPPEYGRVYGPIYNGGFGPGYSSGFNQPFNGGIPGQTGFFGGRRN